MKWFRLYHDLPHDRKIRRFSSEQKWAWVVLLCLASESKQRGLILGEDEDVLAEDCGFKCVQDYQYFLDKLRQQDMIEHVNGGIKITHWDERQFASDDVTKRTSASKAKKRSQGGTFPDCSSEQRQIVYGNDKKTSSDTDTYSDPDSDPENNQAIASQSTFTAEPRSHVVEVNTCDEGQPLMQVESHPSHVNNIGLALKDECSAAPRVDPAEVLMEIYNQDKPEKWAACRTTNDKRRKWIRTFVKEHKKDSIELFRKALWFAAQDPWWGSKVLGFDTLTHSGNVLKLAERYEGAASRETREQRDERLAVEAIQELMEEKVALWM
jgi:hypothetical protein